MKSTSWFVLLIAVALAGCNNDDNVTETPTPIVGPKLRSTTTYFLGKDGFRPADKNVFTYDDFGRLERKEYSTYDVVDQKFDLFSVSNFTYDVNKLKTIDELIAGTQRQTTEYTYSGDQLTKMVFTGQGTGTTVTVQYLPGDTVRAFYQQSNNRSFTYLFHAPQGNIRYEKTIDDSNVVASVITNDFDGYTNPYSLLGYTDLLFTNLSKSNKVKTESAYFTNMPQAVPATYEYTYNDQGLPAVQTITYKSYPEGSAQTQMKVVFAY